MAVQLTRIHAPIRPVDIHLTNMRHRALALAASHGHWFGPLDRFGLPTVARWTPQRWGMTQTECLECGAHIAIEMQAAEDRVSGPAIDDPCMAGY